MAVQPSNSNMDEDSSSRSSWRRVWGGGSDSPTATPHRLATLTTDAKRPQTVVRSSKLLIEVEGSQWVAGGQSGNHLLVLSMFLYAFTGLKLEAESNENGRGSGKGEPKGTDGIV